VGKEKEFTVKKNKSIVVEITGKNQESCCVSTEVLGKS